MMKIDDAVADVWKSVTLTQDETWQVRQGALVVDTDPVEANRLGIELLARESMSFKADQTVYYKLGIARIGLTARVAH
jgi:hypothetical protein